MTLKLDLRSHVSRNTLRQTRRRSSDAYGNQAGQRPAHFCRLRRTKGPFDGFFEFFEIGRGYGEPYQIPAKDLTRIKMFPEAFPLPTLGTVHAEGVVQLAANTPRLCLTMFVAPCPTTRRRHGLTGLGQSLYCNAACSPTRMSARAMMFCRHRDVAAGDLHGGGAGIRYAGRQVADHGAVGATHVNRRGAALATKRLHAPIVQGARLGSTPKLELVMDGNVAAPILLPSQ